MKKSEKKRAAAERDFAKKYPQAAKIGALNGANDRIGEFLEWLQHEKGWTIMEWALAGNNGEPRFVWKEGVKVRKLTGREIAPDDVPDRTDEYNGDAERNPDYESWSEGYRPVMLSIEQIIAEYFGIDLKAYHAEREALYKEMVDNTIEARNRG